MEMNKKYEENKAIQNAGGVELCRERVNPAPYLKLFLLKNHFTIKEILYLRKRTQYENE